jgi:hypothetical protein
MIILTYVYNRCENQLLNSFFSMQGVPHYALIDKEGNISKKTLHHQVRPGSGKNGKPVEVIHSFRKPGPV